MKRAEVGETRNCPRCGVAVVADERRIVSGNWKCAPCKAAINREYAAANRERKNRNHAAWRAANRDRFLSQLAAQKARYLPNNRQKQNARQAVFHALKTGKLTRQPCEGCGSAEVTAHHEDYAKPLDVRWLCRQCHASCRARRSLSRRARIARNPRRFTRPT